MYYTWQRGAHRQLSKSFNSYEFECPCGQCMEQRISMDLVDNLQKVRDDLGDVVAVNSGYRCEAHQKELAAKGYPTATVSQHTLGNAADITSRNIGLGHIVHKYFMAVGIGKTFFHVDERRDKYRTWNY